MILYGASGHAKVIVSCLRDSGLSVTAIFDDDPSKTILSDIKLTGQYQAELFPEHPLIIAIGDNRLRENISKTILHSFGIVQHPSALVDETVSIGEGTVIMHRAVIQAETIVGKHVIINTMASVDHECNIGDFAHIAPGVILCGNVKIGKGTLIGAGSVIVPNVTIGSNCVISAGSIIKHNIPDGILVKGMS